MQRQQVQLPLKGFGTETSQAEVEVGTLTGAERLRRGATPPAIGLGVAILVLPIPIIHLAVPPLALVGGVVLGVRRALQRRIFAAAHGPCPFCGVEQTFGLTGAAYRLPRDLKCRSCGKLLTLEAA
jgi:hypothetical protein